MNHTVAQREACWKQEESRPNLTGIPSQMKQDFESRSQMSYDDVRVHYNSELPAKVGALACTQGTQVYLGPGQGRHLRHELTHVAQQKAGLVAPTTQIGGLPVNNDPRLERLADSGIVPRVPATLTVQRQVLQRAPGDAQNNDPLPSIAEIANKRFCHLYIQDTGSTTSTTMYRILWEIYYHTSNAANATEREQQIQAALTKYGLPQTLVNLMLPKMEAGQFQQAETIFNNYYEGFNHILQTDINNISPETANDTERKVRLNILCKVLNELVIQRVNNAIKDSKKSWFSPGGRGIQELKTKDWTGWLPYLINYFDLVKGTTRFNVLAFGQQHQNAQNPIPPAVPNQVEIGIAPAGGYTKLEVAPSVGEQSYGFATGPSQVVHEHGHLLENNLGVNDFANLHRFLRARSRSDQQRDTGWGTLTGTGKGYDAELPPMEFQNWLSRNMPSNHSVTKFLLYNFGNWMLSLSTKLLTLDLARNYAQQFVDDFFLQESNSETTSYATQINGGYSTEFVSTTAELLSTERGARKVIEADPTRVALFFYLADKIFYGQLDRSFKARQRRSGQQVMSLDEFLHIK